MEESVHDWIVRNYCDEQDELFFNGEKTLFEPSFHVFFYVFYTLSMLTWNARKLRVT